MERIMAAVSGLRDVGSALAPYVMLELVMPGGTLMALLLYLHRRRAATATPSSSSFR